VILQLAKRIQLLLRESSKLLVMQPKFNDLMFFLLKSCGKRSFVLNAVEGPAFYSRLCLFRKSLILLSGSRAGERKADPSLRSG
jgi:hypothetical protein